MATQQMNAVVIDMHTRNAAADGDASKQGSSLFGPNIGIVNNGPAWTNMQEKKMVVDELTQDIVKGWIEKSKDVSRCCLNFDFGILKLYSLLNRQQRSKLWSI